MRDLFLVQSPFPQPHFDWVKARGFLGVLACPPPPCGSCPSFNNQSGRLALQGVTVSENRGWKTDCEATCNPTCGSRQTPFKRVPSKHGPICTAWWIRFRPYRTQATAPRRKQIPARGWTRAHATAWFSTCWCSAANEGMTPINHPLGFL